MTLRTIIADDEPLALKRLRQALDKMDGIEVVGVADDGLEAGRLIAEAQPDLVLLDIMMPGQTGIELAKAFSSSSPPELVFITAHDSYAIKAFDQGAIDYVLKPLDEARLARAIDRARKRIRTRDADRRNEELRYAFALLGLADGEERDPVQDFDLWISEGDRVVRVLIRDVLWFEAAGDYVVVHVRDSSHVIYDRLGSLSARLPPDFMRVHRGAIVRKSEVKAVERLKFGGLRLRLNDDQCVSVGRTYRKPVRELFRDAIRGVDN